MPPKSPKKPVFRFLYLKTGELTFVSTARAQVADKMKRLKADGAYGPQLSKEEVFCMRRDAVRSVK